VQRAWLRFCDKLARAGLSRASVEGRSTIRGAVARRLPERESAVHAIASLYVEQRYGRGNDAESVARFKTLVREFAP